MPVKRIVTSAFNNMDFAKMSCLIIELQLEDTSARKMLPAGLVRVAGPGSKRSNPFASTSSAVIGFGESANEDA